MSDQQSVVISENDDNVHAVDGYNQTVSKVMHSLRADKSDCDHVGIVLTSALAIHENQRSEVTMNATTGSIKCAGGKPGQGYPAVITSDPRAIAFQPGNLARGAGAEPNYKFFPTLGATTQGDQRPHVAESMAVTSKGNGTAYESDVTNALCSAGGGQAGQGYMAARVGMQVRRLTPTECERLQGFPDGHTKISWRGKDADACPDGPRYKALGNSMAVPCMRWIGSRINAVEQNLRYLSVCSGIEAASTAWEPLGWKPAAFSEIEKFPSAVLAHHWPDVPNLGDMTNYENWNELGAIDLLVGGTPCQSFSVAGLRKGLRDPRGGLMLTFLEIARRFGPRWIVWENVPGVLSSHGGRDFGSFLGALGELGYGWAYRVLDAQWFGVAQRRRRVFVVGYLGNWELAAKVLFESESVCRNPAPSREKGKGSSSNSRGGAAPGGWPADVAGTLNKPNGAPFFSDQEIFAQNASHLVPETSKNNTTRMRESGQGYWMEDTVAGTIDANMGCSGHSNRPAVIARPVSTARMVAFGEYVDDGTASAMKARDYKDATDLVTTPIDLGDGEQPSIADKKQ